MHGEIVISLDVDLASHLVPMNAEGVLILKQLSKMEDVIVLMDYILQLMDFVSLVEFLDAQNVTQMTQQNVIHAYILLIKREPTIFVNAVILTIYKMN